MEMTYLLIIFLQHVKLAVPSKFLDGIFSDTQSAAALWTSGQGRHVVGVLFLSKLYNGMRTNQFSDDKIGRIQAWDKVPVVGTPIYL